MVTDLPQFVQAFRRIAQTEENVEYSTDDNGMYSLYAESFVNLESSVQRLSDSFVSCPIIKSDYLPVYRESIASSSSELALSKSPNRWTRLWGNAEPLNSDFIEAIEKREIILDHTKYKKGCFKEFDLFDGQ